MRPSAQTYPMPTSGKSTRALPPPPSLPFSAEFPAAARKGLPDRPGAGGGGGGGGDAPRALPEPRQASKHKVLKQTGGDSIAQQEEERAEAAATAGSVHAPRWGEAPGLSSKRACPRHRCRPGCPGFPPGAPSSPASPQPEAGSRQVKEAAPAGARSIASPTPQPTPPRADSRKPRRALARGMAPQTARGSRGAAGRPAGRRELLGWNLLEGTRRRQ